MKRMQGKVRLVAAMVALACAMPASYAQLTWTTIANNGVPVPGTTANFNSYNQPAVNSAGMVVFRARGKVPTTTGELTIAEAAAAETVTSGVFMRDMSSLGPITTVAKRGDTVPQPNNTLYNGVLAAFTEFPSSPRIDASSSLVATRGQSEPVYTYLAEDGVTETRVGTAGIYVKPGDAVMTGVGLFGAVKEVQPGGAYAPSFAWHSVPDAPAGTRFDQFPGSPTVTNGTKVAFKGNFTNPADTLGYTGVYYRDVVADGGKSPTIMIASSLSTLIPNQPAGGAVKFGATAGPSSANGYVAFTGWDVEEAPTMGGIYRAPMAPSPALQTLIGIGQQVPGEPEGSTFRNFGEGLSMSADGRYVAAWGTWGSETTSKTLYCPVDGNVDLLAYCNATYPDGLVVNVPVKQGIFVADAQTQQVFAIAKAGQDGITDFLFWGFSGAPPGVGGSEDDDREPPRWRSAAFAALASKAGALYGNPAAPSPYQVAFKATRNGVAGIYLRKGQIAAPLDVVVEALLSQGQSIDPQAPVGSIATAVGIERDGFRHENLAITVSMLYETVETSIGWAGLYLAKVPALLAGELSADQAGLDFGALAIDATSAARAVVLTNIGQRPVPVSSVTLASPHFAIAGNTCPAELAPAATCSISVTFAPKLVGTQYATLDINGSALSLSLTGTGTFGESVLTNVTSVINGYYSSLFNRTPDPEGMAYWMAEYGRLSALGADAREVFYALARTMLNSPEYLARNTSDAQFITDLYESFLMRAPDAEGLAYWLAQMQAGLDRRVITSAFIFSTEYTTELGKMFGTNETTRPEFKAVTDMYRGFLNRLPESQGFTFWLAAWQQAQCAGPAAVADAAEAMSQQFLGSAEFAARYQAEGPATRTAMIVASFYDTFMRRGADAQGFNFWVQQLAAGTMSVDDVRRAFIASPEFQSRIDTICAAGCVVKK